MRWRIFGLIALLSISPVEAKEIPVYASLRVQFVKDSNALAISVGVLNRTGRSLCFVPADSAPILFTPHGGRLQTWLKGNIVSMRSQPSKVNVVWPDQKIHVFDVSIGGMDRPFQTDGKVSRVKSVNYNVVLYDCATFVTKPLGKAPILVVVQTSAQPEKVPVEE